MRPTIRTLLLTICTVVVLAACSGTATSPSPSAPAPASPTLPASAPPVSQPPEGTPVPAIPTSVGHSLDCNEEETECRIHRTDDSGGEAVGWPVTVDGPCFDLRTGPDGIAYVGCSPAAGAMLHVLDLEGRPVDGWPVQVPGAIPSVGWNDFSIGCGSGRSAIELGSDGSVYVAISTAAAASVHVFNPDGRPRDGWPQTIPGDAPGQDGFGGDGCRGFALLDDDGVVAWGYDGVEEAIELRADRTEFTSWSVDGQLRPGWPQGSTGAASGPLLDSDGGITYVSATGKVWSHDDAGKIRPGWPYQLDHAAPPFAARDGRVVAIEETEESVDRLVMLGRDGKPVGGSPIDLPSKVETACIFGDTPCAGIVFPAFADDGTIYLALASPRGDDATDQGGAIIALDPDGRVVDGWPVQLAPRTHALELSVDVEDRLVAKAFVCGQPSCGEGGVETTLVFAPDGTPVE